MVAANRNMETHTSSGWQVEKLRDPKLSVLSPEQTGHCSPRWQPLKDLDIKPGHVSMLMIDSHGPHSRPALKANFPAGAAPRPRFGGGAQPKVRESMSKTKLKYVGIT